MNDRAEAPSILRESAVIVFVMPFRKDSACFLRWVAMERFKR